MSLESQTQEIFIIQMVHGEGCIWNSDHPLSKARAQHDAAFFWIAEAFNLRFSGTRRYVRMNAGSIEKKWKKLKIVHRQDFKIKNGRPTYRLSRYMYYLEPVYRREAEKKRLREEAKRQGREAMLLINANLH